MSTYKILSLSGGGVRGILPATVLGKIGSMGREKPLAEEFDLIAGTSTGAIIALSLAHGMEPGKLADFYVEHAKDIFRSRNMRGARTGPRFSTSHLRAVLEEVFGDATMGDLAVDVLIPSVAIDRFSHKIFMRHEPDDVKLRLVDVALASAAAPVYFSPVTPTGSEISFVDGGVWANDPSAVAVDHAISTLGLAPEQIRLLALGTGRVFMGRTPEEIAAMRTYTPDTLRYLGDLVGSTQSERAKHICEQRLGPASIVRIDPELRRWIRLDEHRRANAELPALAAAEFTDHRNRITALLDSTADVAPDESELDKIRRSLDRFTKHFYAEVKESAAYRYEVGETPDEDRIRADFATTVLSDDPVHWRRVHSYSDTPPPVQLRLARWDGFSQQGPLDAVPVIRTDSKMGAVVFFDKPVPHGETVHWTYLHDWPGFFDMLRRNGEDSVETHVDVPMDSLTFVVVLPSTARGVRARTEITIGEQTAEGPGVGTVEGGSIFLRVVFDAPVVGADYKLIFSVDSASLRP